MSEALQVARSRRASEVRYAIRQYDFRIIEANEMLDSAIAGGGTISVEEARHYLKFLEESGPTIHSDDPCPHCGRPNP